MKFSCCGDKLLGKFWSQLLLKITFNKLHQSYTSGYPMKIPSKFSSQKEMVSKRESDELCPASCSGQSVDNGDENDERSTRQKIRRVEDPGI